MQNVLSHPRRWGRLVAVCALLCTGLLFLPAQTSHPSGSIHGVVVDRQGQVCEGARASLLFAGEPAPRTAVTDSEGRYLFGELPAGAFTLTISSDGFTPGTVTATLADGQSYEAPPVTLAVTAQAEVEVSATQTEIALAQFHLEERQRVLGVMPNFFVSYTPDAPALTRRQKFHLAWANQRDPVTIATLALTAGIEQSSNDDPSWGQGPGGYAHRYAVAYADDLTGTFLGSALLPSLFHQDPRFFFKPDGTRSERILYALRSELLCRGDNGRSQFNYSGLLGSLASAGITRYLYPATSRHGLSLTFQSIAIGKATGAAQNIFQELFGQKLTRRGLGSSQP